MSQPENLSSRLHVTGVIPARYGSTRFPGKPLKLILGKPLLSWVIEASKQSKFINTLLVATDHPQIKAVAESNGVEAVMTSSELPTGTDRVWAAVQTRQTDLILNIQGDEPLLVGETLDQLISPFLNDASLDMATLGRPMTREALLSPNTAKIVLNARDEALYFSRFGIPYSRLDLTDAEAATTVDSALRACLKHVGLYAFRKEFLRKFCQQAPTALEQSESLEQLRALYLGARIKVVRTTADSWGVDAPEDVTKIEKMLRERATSHC